MRLSALKLPCLLSAALVLSACGSVSGLTRESSSAPQHIADYTRVEVADFDVRDEKPLEDPSKQVEHLAKLNKARALFADKIAERIRESGAFAEVAREPGTRPALRISGNITRYDEGNIVARGLTGFAGQTHFDVNVEITDAESGKLLSTLT